MVDLPIPFLPVMTTRGGVVEEASAGGRVDSASTSIGRCALPSAASSGMSELASGAHARGICMAESC
jgi:hypothetical protein